MTSVFRIITAGILLLLIAGAVQGLAVPDQVSASPAGAARLAIEQDQMDSTDLVSGQDPGECSACEGQEKALPAASAVTSVYPRNGQTGVPYNVDVSFSRDGSCIQWPSTYSVQQNLTDLSTGQLVGLVKSRTHSHFEYSPYGICVAQNDTFIAQYWLKPNTQYRHWVYSANIPGVGYYTSISTFTTGKNPWVKPRIVFRSGEWILDVNYDGVVDDRDRFGMAGDRPFIGWWNESSWYRGVFRNGEWIYDYNFDGIVDSRDHFGTKGDFPLIYYDFENKTRVRAVFRPAAYNNWIIDRGMDGVVDSRSHFGNAGDRPLMGYYGGDKMPYRVVFRNGEWIWDDNMDGTVNWRGTFGTSGDLPFVGVFDNVASVDMGVFRAGTWKVDYKPPSFQSDYEDFYGWTGDIPLYWV